MNMNKKYFCLISFILVMLFLLPGAVQASLIQDLDATVPGSVTGDPVTEWADQSGNGNHAVDDVGNVYYPSSSLSASGLAGLDFGTGRNTLQLFDAAASDSWLDQSSGGGFCVFVAFKADGLVGDWNDVVGNSSAVTSGFGLRYSNVGAMQAYLGGLTINHSGAVVSAGDTIVYAFNYDAATDSYEFWDSKSDSSKTGSVAAADFSLSIAVTLGSTTNSGRYMNGMVGEIKVYDTELNTSQFQTERDGLVTKWIEISDPDPPTPNPATWASAPSAVNAFSIVMTATTGSDISGVEYLFTETSGNPGGTSSGWQSSPTYQDDFLDPLTQYSYTVTMRDTLGNTGTPSSVANATTPDVVPGRTTGPPNVVVIYADDLGYSDISYNAPAGSFRYTPRLDSICTNGIYFSNYVTHHVCSPSRAGLLTGKHYTRVGAGPEVGGTLDNSIPNIAKDFQAAGYETAAYGKWHNSSVPDDNGNAIYVSSRELVIPDNDIYESFKGIAWGEGVNAYGFDDWAGFYGGGSDYFDRYGSWAGENDWWINGTFSPHVAGYTQDLIAQNAANFITANAHQPFYIHVAMEAVHTPYHIKRSDLETMCGIVDDIDPSLAWNNVKLLASPTTSNLIQDVEELRCTPGDEFDKDVLDGTLPGFADLVYSTLAYALDNTTGQILDRIDAHGMTNNTIIVFASDNGGTASSGDNWPFTGSKHTLWEGGIHVPAAIWWPGTLDADTAPYSPGDNSYSYMTQYFDLYPTLMAMTGSTLNGTDLDGLDLYSNLVARTATRSGFDDCYFGLDTDWGTVRADRWKLHFNRIPGNQKIELYDLDNDIDESNNVQASNPAERDTLIALFDQWFDSGAVSSNYMPIHSDNISYPLPAPASDILEVQATQTDSLSNPNNGVYVRYAKSETRDYDNYIHANDQFQFDIYVADDSDHIDGIYCTPGNGWTPTFDTNNGVNSEGEMVTEKTLPKGQWVRQVIGMGCRAALPSNVQYIALRNMSAGYYHFYVDNVVIREADGTIRDVVWSQDSDFDVNPQYRYKNVVYYSWEDVTAVSGFPFSSITMTTVDLSTLPDSVMVPDVVGQDQATAESNIVAADLVVGAVTTAYSGSVPAGDVISQDPVGGTPVAIGSSVDLVVSLGEGSVTVPDVVGQAQATAESNIIAAGLVVGTVTTASSETVPSGDVISQDPIGGSSVAAGSPVDLVVSTGPASTDSDWTNGGGDRAWDNSANWDGGVPTSADKAAIRNDLILGPIIDSSTTALALNMVVGDWSSTADTVDMTGGSLTVGGWIILGYAASNNGTFTISAGTVDTGGNLFVGYGGAGTIDMTGGTITVTDTFGIAQNTGSTGNVSLDGGTISSGSINMTSGGLLDITAGTLIVDGDVTSTINGYIGSGWITGYAGAGTVNVDYDISNPGKTTVTATPDSYCGDETCDPDEDQCNCSDDCGTPPSTETTCDDGIDNDCDTYTDCDDSDCDSNPVCPGCGNTVCEPSEDQCNCPEDCGTPPSTETSCTDGDDNDCDTYTDCDDSDCDGDPACPECGVKGDPCTTGADCCSGKCNTGKGTCK